jgi:hypothetical protein
MSGKSVIACELMSPFYPLPTLADRLHQQMRRGLLAFFIACFCLSGCDFVRLLLPHKPTTRAEVLSAMQRCGVSPDSIAWRVTPTLPNSPQKPVRAT